MIIFSFLDYADWCGKFWENLVRLGKNHNLITFDSNFLLLNFPATLFMREISLQMGRGFWVKKIEVIN